MQLWMAVKGFVAAILSLVALCAVALGIPAAFGDVSNLWKWAALGAGIALFIAPVAVAIFGIPAVYALHRTGRTSLRAHVWTGFGISACLATLSALTLPGSEARGIIQIFETVIVLISGPLAAAAFWSVARPDRTIQPG
jgi:hypothetical protein